MEEYFLGYYASYMLRKTKMQHNQKICTVSGEGTVNNWTCQKWFSWSGRQAEIDSNQIKPWK